MQRGDRGSKYAVGRLTIAYSEVERIEPSRIMLRLQMFEIGIERLRVVEHGDDAIEASDHSGDVGFELWRLHLFGFDAIEQFTGVWRVVEDAVEEAKKC